MLSHSALALAITGSFEVELGICHGTAPVGIASVVTKAVGQRILEIDGRPAVDVWRETTGCAIEDLVHQGHLAAWAVGVELSGAGGRTERAIRGAFGFELDTGALILQATVAEGTKVMLQHRTIERVLDGTRTMAAEMAKRLAGRTPRAVLGFECAARTFPFLGEENTRAEHQGLRAEIAPDAPWLGMMAWGEIGPCAGRPAFHNYTVPLLVLTEARA
ncbi:MAG: FIST C-terminal domain-containing protein [Polyangiaceae bacterium]